MIQKKHLFVAMLAGLSFMACKNETKTEEVEPIQEEKVTKPVKSYSKEQATASIMARMMTIPEIKTISRLSISAGLTDMLMEDGPYTLFAPSNDAFEEMNQEVYKGLLDPDNKAQLVALLKNHMVPTELGSAEMLQQLKAGSLDFTALGGAKLVVSMEDEDVIISDDSGTISVVSKTDINCLNGTIHIINTVLTTGQTPNED